MRLHATKFEAKFSATNYEWTVRLDDIEFWLLHLTGIDELKTYYQQVKATDVELEWQGNILKLVSWDKITLIHNEDLYNPDKPRNLAKTVTVKQMSFEVKGEKVIACPYIGRACYFCLNRDCCDVGKEKVEFS